MKVMELNPGYLLKSTFKWKCSLRKDFIPLCLNSSNTGNITGGGNGYQSSPERKSSKQNNSGRAVNSEHENDTDMEIENAGSTNDVNWYNCISF